MMRWRQALSFTRIVQQASEVIEMNHYNYKIGFALFLSLFVTTSHAADTNAGKAQSAVCQGCHGSAGVSNGGMFPSLAGQTAPYIEAQLKKFRSGDRDNATMKSIAGDLSDVEIQNLAAYYASLPGKSAGGDAALAKAGKDKAAMCMGCHGGKFQGNGQFPKLAGQQPQYLEKQLQNFKSGARKGGAMNAMAQNLSEDDMKALAAYIGSL